MDNPNHLTEFNLIGPEVEEEPKNVGTFWNRLFKRSPDETDHDARSTPPPHDSTSGSDTASASSTLRTSTEGNSANGIIQQQGSDTERPLPPIQLPPNDANHPTGTHSAGGSDISPSSVSVSGSSRESHRVNPVANLRLQPNISASNSDIHTIMRRVSLTSSVKQRLSSIVTTIQQSSSVNSGARGQPNLPSSLRRPIRVTNSRKTSYAGPTPHGSLTSLPGLKNYDSSAFRQSWMPDSVGRECYECGSKFTTFRRRHHCRICGQIFCSNCCFLSVPGYVLGYTGELRMCTYCSAAVVNYLDEPAAGAPDNANNNNNNVPHGEQGMHSAGASSSSAQGMETFYAEKPLGNTGRDDDFFRVASDGAQESDRTARGLGQAEPGSFNDSQGGRAPQPRPTALGGNFARNQAGSERRGKFSDVLKYMSPNTPTSGELSIGSGEDPEQRHHASVTDVHVVPKEYIHGPRFANSPGNPDLGLDICHDHFQPSSWVSEEHVDEENEPDWLKAIKVTEQPEDAVVSAGDNDSAPSGDERSTDGNWDPLQGSTKGNRSSTTSSQYEVTLSPNVGRAAMSPNTRRKKTGAAGGESNVSEKSEGGPGKAGLLSDSVLELDPSKLLATTADSMVIGVNSAALSGSTNGRKVSVDVRNGGSKLPEDDSTHVPLPVPLIDALERGSPLSPRKVSTFSIADGPMGSGEAATIEDSFVSHGKAWLKSVLTQSELTEPFWFDVLWPLARQIAFTVRPNVRTRGDDLDIRTYIHVKTVTGDLVNSAHRRTGKSKHRSGSMGPPKSPMKNSSYSNPLSSQVVFGTACTKQVAHVGMKMNITNPRVLIIASSIEYERGPEKFVSMDPIISQERTSLSAAVAKIAAIQPDVLVVGKSVSRIAVELLTDVGVTTLFNVKPAVLRRIARVTEAEIVASPDALIKQPRLGTCGMFRTKILSVSNDPSKHGRLQSLSLFEDCRPDLGCSVILYGRLPKTALLAAKKILKVFIGVLYSMKLEAQFLCLHDVDENATSWDVEQDNDTERGGCPVCVENGSMALERYQVPEEGLEGGVAMEQSDDAGDTSFNQSELNGTKTNDGNASDVVNSPTKSATQPSDEAKHIPGKDLMILASPFLSINLPYLQTARGRSSSTREYFDGGMFAQTLRAKAIQNTSPARTVDMTVSSFGDDELNASDCDLSTNGDFVPKGSEEGCPDVHSFIRTRLVEERASQTVEGMLATYRAQGSRLFRNKLNSASGSPGVKRSKPWSTSNSPKSRRNLRGEKTRPVTGGAHLEKTKTPSKPTGAPAPEVLLFDPCQHLCLAVLFSSFSPKSQNAPEFCINPWVVVMEFYGRNDICLGDFLHRYCFNVRYNCPSEACDAKITSHTRKIAHGPAVLEISVQEVAEMQPSAWGGDTIAQETQGLNSKLNRTGKAAVVANGGSTMDKGPSSDFNDGILCWTWCSKCKSTTPPQTMDDQVWHMSFAVYLQYLLIGKPLRVRATNGPAVAATSNCPHCLCHEHAHFFASGNRVASFTAAHAPKYDVIFPSRSCYILPSYADLVDCIEDMDQVGVVVKDVLTKMAAQLGIASGAPPDAVGGLKRSPSVSALCRIHNSATEVLNAKMKQLDFALTPLRTATDTQIMCTNSQQYRAFESVLLHTRQSVATILQQQWNVSVVEHQHAVKKHKHTPSDDRLRATMESATALLDETPLANQLGAETKLDAAELSNLLPHVAELPPASVKAPRATLALSDAQTTTTTPEKHAVHSSANPQQSLSIAAIPIPFNPSKHYGLPYGSRAPVVVSDSEISSIIAYALNSDKYYDTLAEARKTFLEQDIVVSLKKSLSAQPKGPQQKEKGLTVGQDGRAESPHPSDGTKSPEKKVVFQVPDVDQDELQPPTEPNLVTGPSPTVTPIYHIELQFSDNDATYYCKILFAEHFRLLRKLLMSKAPTTSTTPEISCEDEFVRSLSFSTTWHPKGGKSGATFFKTRDDRFLLKQMSRFEQASFVRFAFNYFHYISTAVSEKKLTALAKIYGVYRIGFQNKTTGEELKLNVLVMENLFYGRQVSKVFDLKGSMRNRLVALDKKATTSDPKGSATGLPPDPTAHASKDNVLLDENFLQMTATHPLYVHPHTKTALNAAMANDSHFLAANLIMDYSLLVAVDDDSQRLIVGIIDYIRTYTWDKRLETWVKSVGVHGTLPTVISPELYCSRFCDAMDVYFQVVPDQWSHMREGGTY